MNIDPKGQPNPDQRPSNTSDAPTADREVSTAMNRQLEKKPEGDVETRLPPSDTSHPESSPIETRQATAHPNSASGQQSNIVKFMDFIREQGKPCLRSDADQYMTRLFGYFKPELSIQGQLADSELDGFIQQSPEHARAVLFLATTLLHKDEAKALRLVTRVAQSDSEAINELMFRWQTIKAVVRTKRGDSSMPDVLNDCKKLAAQDDFMGVWLMQMIKQGIVKAVVSPVYPDELKDTSKKQQTLINGVCQASRMDEKAVPANNKWAEYMLLMMSDPLSFGLLDLLPKLKEPTPELIQIVRQISHDSDDSFRYILLPWFITQCGSLVTDRSRQQRPFRCFVSALGGDCIATDLIKPLWPVYELLVIKMLCSTVKQAEMTKAIIAIEEKAKIKPKNISARVHELRTKGKIAAKKKQVNEGPMLFGDQLISRIKQIRRTLPKLLAPGAGHSSYYQGLLWYFKGLLNQSGSFSEQFPAEEAPVSYLAAAKCSYDFLSLYDSAADLYCARRDYASAADAMSRLANIYRPFRPSFMLDKAEASLQAYRSKSEAVKQLQASSSLPDDVVARLDAQGVDADWLPEGQLTAAKKPVKSKKKSGKKTRQTRKTKPAEAVATPEPSVAKPAQPSSTASPSSSSQPAAESSGQPDRSDKETPARLTALLPQHWPDEIHREMKNISQSDYDSFAELEVLENLQVKYSGKAGIERVYEECAWALIRIQKQPDLAQDYVGNSDYAKASRQILDEAEDYLNRALCRKLGVGLSELPVKPADCTTLAEQRASQFNDEKDRTMFMTGFSFIMQSLGHVRYQREEVVSRGGRQALQFLTRASYGEKLSIRSKGNPA